MQILFAALIFVIVLMALLMVTILTASVKPGSVVQGRLEAIQRGDTFAKTVSDMQLIRDELLSSIPALNRFLLRWGWTAVLRKFISQAGLRVRPGKLVLTCGVLGALAFEVSDFYYHRVFLSLLAAVLGALSPLAYVALRRGRRMKAFEQQFPDVIDLLTRSVSAGHTFTSGLEIVATDMPNPVAGEFRTTFDEQRFGLPIRDALLGLCERIPLVDVRFFVIALLVQKETGGNLAEILENLAHVIRERFRIAGEVRVRTAQGRLTAIILIAMPIIMLVVLKVINPDYINVLFVDRWGQNMLIAAACLQALGAALLWKIVHVKV
jgi:tight adherence protein B